MAALDAVLGPGLEAIARFAFRALVGDRLPILVGLGAGALGGAAAIAYGDSVPKEFYAVCAQINPVFLVALVVEQRLADRLGTTAQDGRNKPSGRGTSGPTGA